MVLEIHQEISQALDSRRGPLAEAITARQYELVPELAERYGERGRRHCLKDAEYHLSYLADAIASASPSLFADYVDWAQVMLASRGIPAGDLARNLAPHRGGRLGPRRPGGGRAGPPAGGGEPAVIAAESLHFAVTLPEKGLEGAWPRS